MADKIQEELLKNAQFRKAQPMAFLNARNSAIEVVKLEGIPKGKKKVDVLKLIKKHQDKFMQEYREFYATEVASVGVAYNQAATIEKVKSTTTREELASVWKAMSADERHDKDIKKLVAELKKNYEEA